MSLEIQKNVNLSVCGLFAAATFDRLPDYYELVPTRLTIAQILPGVYALFVIDTMTKIELAAVPFSHDWHLEYSELTRTLVWGVGQYHYHFFLPNPDVLLFSKFAEEFSKALSATRARVQAIWDRIASYARHLPSDWVEGDQSMDVFMDTTEDGPTEGKSRAGTRLGDDTTAPSGSRARTVAEDDYPSPSLSDTERRGRGRGREDSSTHRITD